MSPAVAAPDFHIHRYPAALIDRLMLADGRSVIVRPVLPQDADGEQAFVGRLSEASRHLRFHVGTRGLPPHLLRAMTEIDYRTHVALVAQTAPADTGDSADDGDEDPIIVADARYVLSDDAGLDAEFAIAVDDAWQGLGLGRQLMDRLIRHARRRGVQSLIGDVLPTNTRMTAMVRRSGGTVQRHPLDATLVQVRFRL